MPGRSGSPLRSRASRLRRISCLTFSRVWPDERSSPMVRAAAVIHQHYRQAGQQKNGGRAVRLSGALTESIRDRYEAAHDEGHPLLGGHRGNHAHTLERTTNGTGMVRDQTAAQLRRLDAGEGEHIPLLQEVIELAIGKVGLVIEIKQVPIQYPGLEEKLVAMLRQLGAVSECAVVSFHHPSIRQLREMEPKLQLGILVGARPIDPARMMREAGADVYSPHWAATDPQLVKEIHSAGGAVGVWTVDDDTAVAWSKLCRPDSVFTNRPVEIGPALRS